MSITVESEEWNRRFKQERARVRFLCNGSIWCLLEAFQRVFVIKIVC